MIDIYRNENNTNNYEKKNSILIIGKGETEFKNKVITKPNSISDVKSFYGDSELTDAYKEAVKAGATNLFLCNCFKTTDFLLITQDLICENFEYVCPLANFSEIFFTNNKNMYLAEIYSNILYENITQVFFTEKKADLYETLEQYVSEMNNIVKSFKERSFNRLVDGSNLCFVLNNLGNYNYANVILATVISNTDLKNYPSQDLGEVIYDLNNYDFMNNEIIYFSYNLLTNTTIENLLNFNHDNTPKKFVPIKIIEQKIMKELNKDLSKFKGKIFNPYISVLVEDTINSTMTHFQNNIIENYSINNINFIRTEKNQIVIKTNIRIKPFNSIEEINIALEV